MFSLVFKRGDDRVLKIPKTYPEDGNPDTAYTNEVNIDALNNEASIYRRLGQHEGILQCIQIVDRYSIELAFANQGDLMKYMEENAQPTEEVRAEWIRRLADSFAYVHSRRVVVDDIHTGNILIHNDRLRLSDFNQSFLLPLDTDMGRFCANGTNPKIEILHLGCVFYSIAVWSRFKYDYFEHNRWPNPTSFPAQMVYSGEILSESAGRGGRYASMDLLRKSVEALLC